MEVVTVIGAGGYVGCQLMERLTLGGERGHRAVVRAYRRMAGLARFGDAIDVQIADAENINALADAIAGSSMVVNVTTGPPSGIVPSTRSIYRACIAAKVPRLVHMSSAVVYGDVESDDIDDDTLPLKRHWMPYARAKSASERWLNKNVDRNACQVAVLRPGIIWGVRSPHTLNVVESLAKKNAFLVDGGHGVFNGIYIDNLLDCIQACRDKSINIAGCFNVSDDEAVTWNRFYEGLSKITCCDVERIPSVSGTHLPISFRSVFDRVQSIDMVNWAYHRLLARLPDSIKASLKSRIAGAYCYERYAHQYIQKPTVDRELWHLQRVRHKLSSDKFKRHFNFTMPVSFGEGMLRTNQWLQFLGYGVKHAC
jgi:2-alkyl-3-oxoalkanoate reductase